MSELKLIYDHLQDLVKVLAPMNADDMLKFWKDLQRYGVITSEIVDTLTSLDQDRLDSKTIVRYLLHIVCERVKVNKTVCNQFLEVLEGVREKGVVQVSRAMAQKLVSGRINDKRVASESERLLLEEDVGNLWEILIEGSYKWEEISILLKLPKAIIEQCRMASSLNLRLHEALTEWVCGNHKDAKLPTLSHLKHVLASATVGLPNLSTALKESKQHTKELNEIEDSNSLILYFQSVDTEVGEGKSTLLEVQVHPSQLANCQWVKNGKTLDSSAFSGIHTAMLLIKEASQETEGKYCCQIQCGSEQLTSSPAKVTVIYPPDKQCLLDMYSIMKEIPEDSWPIANTSEFINLALIKSEKYKNSDCIIVLGEIDRILERKQEIHYDEIFQNYRRNSVILVEGRPGSGKTTLASKIAKDWAQEKILRNVSKLFLVPLRRDYDNSTLFEFFFSSKTNLYLNQLEESGGDKLCFVLDGYDECNQRDDQDSVINKLIFKKYLPLSMIIVTSRPVATSALRLQANSVVEILGFTKEQFDEFVRSYPFSSLTLNKEELVQTELKAYLKGCTNVLNMCYLPLNANIVCFLYSQLQGKVFPKTETEIYDYFVRAILLRVLRKGDLSVKLSSVNELPEKYKQDFLNLCYLAFYMTVDCNQIVKKLPLDLNNSPVCSLLTIDNTISQAGLEDVYSFLHLTLQEYLAAYHLASLDEDLQTEMVKLHSGKDHMLTTFKFYCGLVNFEQKMHQLEGIVMQRPNTLYAVHCAYETQQKTVCCKVIELLSFKIYLGAGVLTQADFNVLGYIISKASHLIEAVDIDISLLHEEYNNARWLHRELDQTDLLSYTFKSTGSLTNIKVWEDKCCASISYNVKSKHTYTKVDEILDSTSRTDVLPWYNTTNQILLCSSDIFASENAIPLADALKQCHNLRQFSFIGNCRSNQSASVVADIYKSFINLQHIQILGCFCSTGGLILAEGLHHLNQLQTLDLRFVKLCDDGTEVLATALKHTKNIKTIILIKCNLGVEGFRKISHCLSGNVLEYLHISMNHIKSEALQYLCLNLTDYSSLKTINLMDNDLDTDGIISLSENLKICFNLQCLNLSHNDIGWMGAAVLAQGLTFCYNLMNLSLDNCNLTGCGITLIAEAFNILKEITHLNISNNGTITAQEACSISDGLVFLNNLTRLYMSNSGIDDESAKALSRGILHKSWLDTVDLSDNCIGDIGVAAIASSLTNNRMLFVDLSCNRISAVSMSSVIDLVELSHVQKLDLSYNNIGSSGAKYLIDKLILYPCTSLKLNLLSNNISQESVEILKEFLENSPIQLLLDASSFHPQLKTHTGENKIEGTVYMPSEVNGEIQHAKECSIVSSTGE